MDLDLGSEGVVDHGEGDVSPLSGPDAVGDGGTTTEVVLDAVGVEQIEQNRARRQEAWDDLRETALAIHAARLDARELEKWEVVPEPDRMPPWSQYRLLSREVESWITDQVMVLVRGQDVPRDTPILAFRQRLDRAMWKRGGIARVWETEPGGDISVYLAKDPMKWKGLKEERDEPLI
jgi:hypothetical protein